MNQFVSSEHGVIATAFVDGITFQSIALFFLRLIFSMIYPAGEKDDLLCD